ncbi:MAG: FAD-dependent oxidoreductase [Anaerolineae bacterium]|nr:FAD-dependent oxidoreductase [Anaerolineae bacterium]
MTVEIHDCIVVGAGPAGSAAALQLARDGLDVVLLERGNRPGEKNVMSGVLFTDKLYTLVPDFRDRAPLQRCIIGEYDYILGEDEVLRLPGLRNYRRSKYRHPPFTVFRSQFDAWFAQEAVDAGAEFFTTTLVEDLLREDGRVAGVRTQRGDLRARVVIGADGVNSTVAEKSGLRTQPSPTEVSLIIREILDLPAERIEERFVLQPGEGVLSLFIGLVSGPTGDKSMYYTELYTNRDSLSLTAEVPLDVLQACGVPTYDVMAAREHHPYIARLTQGATLREYQAHLIPTGGVADLGRLYGDGVLLTGDAGKFVTKDGVGSWPAMASGVAAARAVKYACEKGDFSRAALAVYRDLLEEEGLVDTQREARQAWDYHKQQREILAQYPDRLFHIARRYFGDWETEQEEHPYSLWGEVYHYLLKPLAPWYVRWPLGLAAWVNTRGWRRQQARKSDHRTEPKGLP